MMHRCHNLLHSVTKSTRKLVLIRRSVYMSVLLNVHLKNDDFSISLLHPLDQCCYLSSQFINCMQKVVMSVHRSWDVGLKNPRTILLLELWILAWPKHGHLEKMIFGDVFQVLVILSGVLWPCEWSLPSPGKLNNSLEFNLWGQNLNNKDIWSLAAYIRYAGFRN